MKYLFSLIFSFSTVLSYAQCEDFAQALIFNTPTCYNFSDGSITINVLGGTGGIIFIITDSEGTELNEDNSNTAHTLNEGWYYTYVSDELGCESEDSVFLEDPGIISVDLTVMISNPSPDCDGYAVADTVYNYGGDYENISYFWAPNPSGVEGLGADSSYNFCPGPHSLTVNDENGCSNVFDFDIGELASINENKATGINVITNSATGNITIQLEAFTEPLTFDLYDISGKLMFTAPLNSTVTNLNPHLGSGTYVYAIRNANSILTKGKLVLTK